MVTAAKCITQEQANTLFAIVDADANLVGKNLDLSRVPNFDEWNDKYTEENPEPVYDPDADTQNPNYYTGYARARNSWILQRNQDWAEAVNDSLLEDGVITGACVIGGLTIAALKAGRPVKLIHLVSNVRSFDSMISLTSVSQDLVDELKGFTGLSFEALGDLQRINDSTNPNITQLWSYVKDEYVDNPVHGKSLEECTVYRRERLKEYIQALVI